MTATHSDSATRHDTSTEHRLHSMALAGSNAPEVDLGGLPKGYRWPAFAQTFALIFSL